MRLQTMAAWLALSTLAGCGCGNPVTGPDAGGLDGIVFRPDGGAIVIVTPTEDGGLVPIVDAGPPPNEVFITNIDPANGPETGGTRVLIEGVGFAPDCSEESGQTIFFGDREGIGCVLTAPGLRVTTPPCAGPGTVDVRVVNQRGEAIVEDGFRCFSPIVIEEVDPAIGDVAGGETIAIRGSGFSDDMIVLLGGRQVVALTVTDENNATFITPEGAPGTVDVRASDSFGTFLLELGFTYQEALRVDRVEPAVVDPATSPFIELRGGGFGRDASVEVGGVAATDVNVISAERLRMPLPAGVPLGLVSVRVAQLNGVFVLDDALFVLSPTGGALDISGVAPPSADIAGGTQIAIGGEAFTGASSVTVGGTEVTDFEVVDDRHIIATLPAGTAGAAAIVVTTGAGTATFNGFIFTDDFKVASVTPGVGPIEGGTAVTITGNNFVTGSVVTFGGLPLENAVRVSDTEFTGTTPVGSPGPVAVRVERPDASVAVLRDGFRYETELDVLTISPTEGGIAGGTFVIITGEGFTRPGEVNVQFGNTDAFLVEVISDSIITARAPPSAPSVVDVRVVIGTEADEIPNGFTYFNPSDIVGGAGGGPINGSIYVTAIDAIFGFPVPGLSVFVGTDGTADPLKGEISVTNFDGQATLSGPGIYGAQTVSIVGDGYEYGTVVETNAQEITLFLQPIAGGPPQPPPPGANAPCGDGIIQFPQECDDGMQCDDGQACEEFTCGLNTDCLDGYECVIDPVVGERRCKALQCSDSGDDCFEYRCNPNDSPPDCLENYECVNDGQGGGVCKPMFCEGTEIRCNLQQCDPNEDVETECGVGFTCDQNGAVSRCIPIISSQNPCAAGAVCAPDQINGDCGAANQCERREDCQDGSLCLTRYTDGCTGSPQHGALHCAPDDLLCNQMRQCRPGCEVEITMRGRVFGFAKELFDPALLGPNEIALALVVTTSRDEFSGTPNPCQFNVVFQEGGEYFIARSRPGPLAVVALAGIFNLDTGEFKFRQMGVRRPAFPAPFTHLVEQDIELTIPLDEEVALSMPDAPITVEPDGRSPTITRMVPFIRFGSDGTLAYTDAISTDRNHDLKRMPDVPGDLVTFVGGAFTTDGQGLVTEVGTANSIENDPFVTGIGTNWDITDFSGRPLVEGAIFYVTRDDGERFATTVVTALDATTLQLAERAPFSGAGMTYHIGNPGFPQSEVKQDGTGDITVGGILINPVLGLPEPLSPVDSGALINRTVRWKPAAGEQPNMVQFFLFDPFNFEVLWTFYVDGQRTKVPVPKIPTEAISLFVDEGFMQVIPRDIPVGGMAWQHQAMYVPGFDFSNWSYIDLSLRSRRAWTTDLVLFVNGEQ